MDKRIRLLSLLMAISLAMVITVYAAGTSSSSWEKRTSQENPAVPLYDQGVEATKNNDFKKALALFERALREDRNNPDILNMLAHTQLKLNMVDESLENYKKALKLRPKFPEAREYLGEAYIQAVLREIKILESYGSQAGENLEDLKKAFKDAAENL